MEGKDPEGEVSQKKLKIENENENETKKKERFVIVVEYCGYGYHGLQRNPDVFTVDDELEKALATCGAIEEHNVGFLDRIKWIRGCRTDKDVHALGNVISANLVPVENLAEKMNAILPKTCQIALIQKVTNSFHAQNAIDFRVYTYFCPSYIFSDEPLDSSFWNYVKDLTQFTRKKLNSLEKKKPYDFRIAKDRPDTLKEIQTLLNEYKGSHNFHNFTIQKQFNDPSAKRHMFNVTVSDPFTIENVEFVTFTFQGQSFMLHQIRKMVAAVFIIFKNQGSSKIVRNLYLNRSFKIPLAPGDFLMLDHPIFNGYNSKIGGLNKIASQNNNFEKIEINKISSRIKFRDEVVIPAILQREKKERMGYQFVQNSKSANYDEWTLKVPEKRYLAQKNASETEANKKQDENQTQQGDQQSTQDEKPTLGNEKNE